MPKINIQKIFQLFFEVRKTYKRYYNMIVLQDIKKQRIYTED